MKALLVLTVGELAAAATTDLPPWAYVLGLLIPAIAGGRWYINRRLAGAQATNELANADLTEQQSEKIKEELRLSVLESVRDDMARQRQETARAQAAEKEAIAEVAILIAQHAKDRAEWKEERHAFVNQLADRDTQISLMRAEIDGLRGEVHTLRVALGIEQERRKDNLRLTNLEERADKASIDMQTEQARNTELERLADEERTRNDETPGHA